MTGPGFFFWLRLKMGILYILLAALLFGSNPSVENILLSSGLTADLVAFAVVAVSGILAFFAGIIRKESFRLTSSQLAAVVLTGLIGRGLTEVCLIQAYTLVPPGVATMVHFFFPTVVCAASILLFHEKLTWYKAAAVVLSVCGLYGIADGQTGGSITGVLFAGVTSLTFAFYYLMTERSSLKELPPMAMIFYVHLFGAVTCAAPLIAKGKSLAVIGGGQWLLLILSGSMCFVAFILLNRGIPVVGGGTAAFINMLEPVTSLMLSVVLFKSRLSVMTAAGCFLIVGALFVSALETYSNTESAPKAVEMRKK